MPSPLTINISAKTDVINLPANHGYNYINMAGNGFDGNSAVYRYQLPNSTAAVTITFRDATQAEVNAQSGYFPAYNATSAWIPVINGVNPYNTAIRWVSGQNYGSGPFQFGAAGTSFSSMTFIESVVRAPGGLGVQRVNLRGGAFLPALYSPRSYVPRGYIRFYGRPNQVISRNTPRYIGRVAVTRAPTPRTTGTTGTPPTLNPSPSTATTYCLPSTISASNAGPWYNNRPGFTCDVSPKYGNGSWAWSATAARKIGKSWSGPNLPRFSFDGIDANGDEIWTFSASGWEGCQGPVYTDTKTKARTASSIVFNIGTGTVTIGFTSCNLNTGSLGGAPNPQTIGCTYSYPPQAVYTGGSCSCIRSTTSITINGCPQTVITYQCGACTTPVGPIYPPPTAGPGTTIIGPNGNPVTTGGGNSQTIPPPPPGNGPQNKAIIRNGRLSPIQIVGPDFNRFWNGGGRYELHQPMSLTSVLSKRRRYKPQRLQENASTRLAGAPLISVGNQFNFITSTPEVTITSFDYGVSANFEFLAKKDVGRRWLMAEWEDFANGSEVELLGFKQTFGILADDLSTAGGNQHIVVIGWVKYQGATADVDDHNYLMVYCNKSLPSSLTPIATLNSDYWVLVANTNDDMTAKIICKK